eukprot:538763_1
MRKMSMVKWSYSLLTIFLGLFGPYWYHTWDNYWWTLIPVVLSLNVFDFFVSDRPWKNIEIMKLNGFSPAYIWGYAIFNTASFQWNGYYVIKVIMKDEIMIPRFDLSLILTIIIILCVSDYFFYVAHKLLHSTHIGAKIHLMHHCCIYTSFS